MNAEAHLLADPNLPDEMRDAQSHWVGAASYSESTAFLEETNDDPDHNDR
jgi:hypothetical protein